MAFSSVDPYLSRKFDRQIYNCLHFSRDVWLDLTGDDLTERLQGLLGRVSEKRVERRHSRAFKRLTAALDPCIVLFQRPRASPHMGVFIRGKVLHIGANGVEHMPIDVAARGFKTVKFYK